MLRVVEFLRNTRSSCRDQHFSNHNNLFFSLCDIIGEVFGHYSLHHHPNPTIEHCEMVFIYIRTKVQPEFFHLLLGYDLLDVCARAVIIIRTVPSQSEVYTRLGTEND